MARFTPSFPTPGALPEFASGANRVAVLTLDLSVARDQADLNIGGTALWIVDASSATAAATFFFASQQTSGVPLSRGLYMSGVPFDDPKITNAAQAGQWLSIVYVTEERLDHFEVVNPSAVNSAEITSSIPPTITQLSDAVLPATTNNAVISGTPANPAWFRVQSDAANTSFVRISGSGNCNASTGEVLQPGQSAYYWGTGPIVGYSPVASQTIRCCYGTW